MPEEKKEIAAAANDCILLFGMPRSGTTWLGKLFDSHPDVLYRHEPDTWRRLSIPRYLEVAEAENYADELRLFMNDLPQMNALRVAGKRPLFAKNYMSGLRARGMSVAVELARVGSRAYAEFPVLLHASGDGDPNRRIAWKSIESLGRMGVILRLFKQVRAIQILRHPCGYIASVKRGMASQSFTHQDSGSEDYGILGAVENTPLGRRYDLNQDYMRSLTREERMAWRWVLINEKASQESSETGRHLTVCYEDICAKPLASVEEMFEFAGLAMNTQTRKFVADSTQSSRSGYYSVFKDPVRAAWRWREELDSNVIDRVLAIVAKSDIGARYLDRAAAAETVT